MPSIRGTPGACHRTDRASMLCWAEGAERSGEPWCVRVPRASYSRPSPSVGSRAATSPIRQQYSATCGPTTRSFVAYSAADRKRPGYAPRTVPEGSAVAAKQPRPAPATRLGRTSSSPGASQPRGRRSRSCAARRTWRRSAGCKLVLLYDGCCVWGGGATATATTAAAATATARRQRERRPESKRIRDVGDGRGGDPCDAERRVQASRTGPRARLRIGYRERI